MSELDSPRHKAPPTGAPTALAAYTEVIGHRPALWRRGARGWSCGDDARSSATGGGRWSAAIASHLDGGVGADGFVVSLAADRILVALPIEAGEDGWAAVCVLKASDLPLVRRLASAAVTIQRERLAAGTPVERRPALHNAARISELAWFRSIVDQVRLCDARIEHSQVADEVLPRLRGQIGAEAVAWVREVTGTGNGAAPPIIVWCGHALISDTDITEIISEYGRRAMLRPALCDISDVPSDRHWPKLHGFVLVRVPECEGDGSWLLALNRKTGATGPRDRQFSHFEAGLLQVAAAVLSTHARNLGVLLDQEHVMQRVIHGMSGAIDARDAYTRGHSERVGRFARRIGMKLRLEAEEIEQLYLTGLLHDIGKIGIPDRVLLKSGSLTGEEFELIKQHPEIGHRILEPISELAYALPGVLHHHERIDGRGYPHGLSGNEIPLSARILAVADAFDAMTSTRTYRAAMTADRATSILNDGRGIQWDGEIVDAFLAVMPEFPLDPAPPANATPPDEFNLLLDDDENDADNAKNWANLSMFMKLSDAPNAG